MATVVAIDSEDEIALSLYLLAGGVGGLGFYHNPPQRNDNRPSHLILCGGERREGGFEAQFGEVLRGTDLVPRLVSAPQELCFQSPDD